MVIKNNIAKFSALLKPFNARLIAVTKTHPVEKIREAYDAGQRLFGENKVQEMLDKQPLLPADVEWHLIGHLQRNKVRFIAPFIGLIHSVDSLRLLREIDKQGEKNSRIIHCLLQVFIATEETKFGLDPVEVEELIMSPHTSDLKHIRIDGLMGMASMTENKTQVRAEFQSLKKLFEKLRNSSLPANVSMTELSMGMTSDHVEALEEGSTLVRVGTAIFGARPIAKDSIE